MEERSIWAEVRTIIPFFAHFSVKAHRLRRFPSIPEVAALQMEERSISEEVRTIIPFFAHFSVKAHRLRRFRSIPEVAAPQIGERSIWAEARSIIPFFAHFSVKAHRVTEVSINFRSSSAPDWGAIYLGGSSEQLYRFSHIFP